LQERIFRLSANPVPISGRGNIFPPVWQHFPTRKIFPAVDRVEPGRAPGRASSRRAGLAAPGPDTGRAGLDYLGGTGS
tara:strand:- start:5704 stop:5937 length:234 start_codon:yes stop_codon:yes gene_type:complete